MAGLAADAVCLQIALTPQGGGGIGGMAAEAGRRGGGGAEAERGGDLLATMAGEDRIGPAVGPALRGRILPVRQFVLADDLAVAFGAAMAGGSGAGGDALKGGIGEAAGGIGGGSQAEQAQHGDQQRPGAPSSRRWNHLHGPLANVPVLLSPV